MYFFVYVFTKILKYFVNFTLVDVVDIDALYCYILLCFEKQYIYWFVVDQTWFIAFGNFTLLLTVPWITLGFVRVSGLKLFILFLTNKQQFINPQMVISQGL